MTKKQLVFLLVTVVAVVGLLVAGCAPEEAAPPEEEEAPPEEEEAEVEPVVIRVQTHNPPPPHPAAIALTWMKEELPKRIPGSEMRIYWAGGLYSQPDAMEAVRDGFLEAAWGEFGTGAQVNPWMNLVTAPGTLSTPGAMLAAEDFESTQALFDNIETTLRWKLFGVGHISLHTGLGSDERLLTPDDFAGKKIRTFAPVHVPLVEAMGGSAVTMDWGDVPSGLQSGVIDGVTTTLGGLEAIPDLIPYFTVAGINGVVQDFYFFSASRTWWDGLPQGTQEILEELSQETLELQKAVNWCNDQKVIDKYGTNDPEEPGLYLMSPEEAQELRDLTSGPVLEWLGGQLPDAAENWLEVFADEASTAVEENPLGTSWIEEIDCADYAHFFGE